MMANNVCTFKSDESKRQNGKFQGAVNFRLKYVYISWITWAHDEMFHAL